MTWLVEQADVLEWASKYSGPKFHAILCDPPYHLNFMNSKWDGGDIAFRPETWAALVALLHPGAFVFAFVGCRGYHRMACAMEDSGLIIHPAIGWLFGSGWPKATRIDTQIDKRAGFTPDLTTRIVLYLSTKRVKNVDLPTTKCRRHLMATLDRSLVQGQSIQRADPVSAILAQA